MDIFSPMMGCYRRISRQVKPNGIAIIISDVYGSLIVTKGFGKGIGG
jgi:hypothetical protein